MNGESYRAAFQRNMPAFPSFSSCHQLLFMYGSKQPFENLAAAGKGKRVNKLD